jgi:hypothetical protein
MKYPSKYSNGKTVSAAQYITEIICEHLALKRKQDLHYRFWISKEWEKFYKSQIFSANKLLKNFDPKAIIRALETQKGKKIYSLRAPHLLPIIQQQQTVLDSENNNMSKPIERYINNKGSNLKNRNKNTIDKLKDIENGN